MNKKIIITTVLTIFGWTISTAQISIGKEKVSSSIVSLEFGDTEARGILLPWTDSQTAVDNAVNGTMIYDVSDQKVKVKYASGWTDLSVDENGTLDGATQPMTENEKAQVRIGGNETDTTAGILVLADTDKAMVLPKVNNTDEILNPTAGMMVYVESKQLLALFNGTVWTFWKAN